MHLPYHTYFLQMTVIKANVESACHILNMLEVFEKASGQQINVEKSSVFYSRNWSNQLKQEMIPCLPIKEANDNSYYLGLPNMILGKKICNFWFCEGEVKGSNPRLGQEKAIKG